MKLLIIFILVFSLLPSAVNAKKNLDWWLDTNSEALARAKQFQEGSEFPNKITHVLDVTEVSIKNNTVKKRVKSVWFYPSFKETNDDGTQTFYWDQAIENLVILGAGVVDLKGKVHQVESKNVRVIDNDDYNTFTNYKLVTIPYAGLKEKSSAFLEYEVTYNLNDLESGWSEASYPVTLDPVLEYRFEVTADRPNSYTFSSTSDQVQCIEDSKKYLCSGENLKPYVSDKGVVWRDLIGQIRVSEFETWEQVKKKVRASFDTALDSENEIDDLVSKITLGKADQADKIEAIFKYVSRDIRYVSMSELGNRITPHKNSEVIKNAYGDCKDKAALLVTMLKKIGVDAYPSLVSTTRKDVKKMLPPSTNFFDHMVVCYDVDTKKYCLDATDTSTNWRTVSSWIQGRAALHLNEENIGTIPSYKYKWNLKVRTNLSFDENAEMTESQQREYIGTYAGTMRNLLDSYDEKERKDWIVENYQSNIADSVSPDFQFEGVQGMGNKVRIKSQVKYDAFLDKGQDFNFEEYDGWLRDELSSSIVETKYYDAQIEGLSVHSVYTIDSGPNWNINRLPANQNFESEYGSMVRKSRKLSDNKIEVMTSLTIPRQKLLVEQIKNFNEFIEVLYAQSKLVMHGKESR